MRSQAQTRTASKPGQYALDFSGRRPPKVQDRIERGMRQADENADGRWKHIFDACILAVAKKKPELTSDDVLEEIAALPNAPSTHNLAAIGAAMIRASDMGIIKRTDRVQRSRRPEKHGNRQNVWTSNYYDGGSR